MSYIKNAKFIGADPEWKNRVPKFRKEFALTGAIESAELQISSLGIFEAYLNGSRVGDAVLTPGWTEYEKRLQYLTYDVTDIIAEKNEITVGVGHGWWGERMGCTKKDAPRSYGETPAVIAALKLVYKDGREEYVFTDESWSAAKSETLESEIYDGEKTDARIEPVFDEPVYEYGDTAVGELVPYEGELIKEIESVKPRAVIVTPKGETVLDFGQNLTGYLEFTVTGNAGHTVAAKHFEILDKDGNVYTENYRSADALLEYTLKDGKQTYKARYTFYGFRYVQLIDWCEEIKPENFTAIVVCSDIKRTGYFKCGHAKLNKLYENVIWGQKGNFVDVPTDCPQRDERLGWTGDTEVFCRTGCLNFDSEKFYKKWLHDLALAQKPDGMVPRVVPNSFWKAGNEMGSAAWGDAATVVPYEVYMAYGDKTVLCDGFEAMKKWVGFIEGRSTDYVWTVPGHFGDWLGMDAPAGSYRGSTSEQLIATAYFYLSCGLTVKTGKIIGEDVSKYEQMLPKIKEAFNRTFVKDGKLTSDTQTAHVLALHFGLVDGELRDNVAKRLIELIEGFGDRLQTGFVGTPYLLDTLTDIGRADKAYTLLLQEKFPSWLFSVNMGATTIWEHWDGLREDGSVWSKDMNSFNHYAYGAVASWMYRTVCGIRYDEKSPAYKHFFISPIPNAALGFAKAKLDTRNGAIVSEWVCEGQEVRYTFTIPCGMTATVTLDGVSEELSAGTYTRYGKI